MFSRRYCILDIEAVGLCQEKLEPGHFSKHHFCRRKTALRTYTGVELVLDGNPCIPEEALKQKDRKSFQFCQEKIHHLSYQPKRPYFECRQIAKQVWRFLEVHNIEIVFHKGGDLERDLCYEIGIECMDLARFGISKYPEKWHDPLEEIRFFYHSMVWKRDLW